VHRASGQGGEDERPDLAASDGPLTRSAASEEAAELARQVVEIVVGGPTLVTGRAVMASVRRVRTG